MAKYLYRKENLRMKVPLTNAPLKTNVEELKEKVPAQNMLFRDCRCI